MNSIEDNIISVHLMKTLHRMRENGEFCDLVFELNNSKFSAHQLVMAVWSPPMKNLLQLQPASTQHVRVAYDKPEDFQKFITFLYTGILPEQTTNILAVLNIAATFQIHILTELCKTYLKTNTTEDNVINMCHLSMKFKLHDLERHCVEFVCQHMTKIVQNQEFRDLTLIQINSLLGSDYMTKLEPEIKLFLIISWLAEDVHSREHVFVLLLKHVDWSLVAIDYLKEIIETENFFTANPSSLYLLLQTIDSSSFSLGPYENHLWTLRQQYSSLLSNVINNCAAIDLNKTQPFQPLSFSLVVSPNEELYSPDQNMVTTKTVGIKNELLQIVDFDKTYAHDDTVDSGILQSQMNSSLNMPISTLNTPECRDGNETSSYTQIREKCLLSKSASVPSITVEGSLKRKFLRPHKIVTDTVLIKKQSLKVHSNRNKKIVSKLHNTRGRLQGKVTSNENVLRFVDNEISTEDFKTNDKNRTVMKNVTAVRKENVRRKDLRKHHGSKGTVKYLSVAKGLEDTVHVEDSSDQQMNQGGTDLKVQERKKILQRLSLRNNRAKRARNTGSDLKKTLNQRKEIRRKDSKLQIQKCNECTFTTYNPVMLDKHQKQVHEGNCLFCCNLCSFKTKWGKDYYGHMKKSHFPGPPFCCDEEKCDYNTDKFPELISHRQQHHDQRPFVCDICLTAFRSKNNLYQHIKIHSDEKRFQCPECSRFFKLKITLDQHMVTHSDLRPYLCDLCGFSTKFQSHLICHKRIHTGM
uniref:BTB domain-containing protein n=1 Tax=Arion vulgaris TaxID=1028688 RepID=A0A0B7BIX3_9EUPU